MPTLRIFSVPPSQDVDNRPHTKPGDTGELSASRIIGASIVLAVDADVAVSQSASALDEIAERTRRLQLPPPRNPAMDASYEARSVLILVPA